jgi:hypothetical protein
VKTLIIIFDDAAPDNYRSWDVPQKDSLQSSHLLLPKPAMAGGREQRRPTTIGARRNETSCRHFVNFFVVGGRSTRKLCTVVPHRSSAVDYNSEKFPFGAVTCGHRLMIGILPAYVC